MEERTCPITSRPLDVIQCLPSKYIEQNYPVKGEPSALFHQRDIIVYDIGNGEAIGVVLYASKETDKYEELRTDSDGNICYCDILRFATWDDIKNLYPREIESGSLHIEWGMPMYPMPLCQQLAIS